MVSLRQVQTIRDSVEIPLFNTDGGKKLIKSPNVNPWAPHAHVYTYTHSYRHVCLHTLQTHVHTCMHTIFTDKKGERRNVFKNVIIYFKLKFISQNKNTCFKTKK